MPIPDPYAPVDLTADQEGRIERLRDAGGACRAVVERAVTGRDLAQGAVPRHLIETACRTLAQTVAELCPPSADRAAAERCVRLARVLGSDAQAHPEHREYLLRMAIDDLLRAEVQACVSVALSLPAELPPLT
jgi:hypothetical protein